MDKKICTECNTENEAEYSYCKNCGTPLNPAKPEEKVEFINEDKGVRADVPPVSYAPPINNTAPNMAAESVILNGKAPVNGPFAMYESFNIGGIPADEVALYIGKKHPQICPKLIKLEASGSKASWCWPAAVLSFLLGPIGGAFWFLYRKMYKIAIILMAIGTVLTFASSAFSGGIDEQTIDNLATYITEGNSEAFLTELEGIEKDTSVVAVIVSGIADIANIAVAVAVGVFGYYAYKEDIVKKINRFRMSNTDMRYYRIGIASLGGVSGGMLAVGIVAFVVVANISTAITTLVSLI